MDQSIHVARQKTPLRLKDIWASKLRSYDLIGP